MSTLARPVRTDVVTIIDDEPAFRLGIASVLAKAGYEAEEGPPSLPQLTGAARPRVIITDRPEANLELLDEIVSARPDAVILAVLEEPGPFATAAAIRRGANAVIERNSQAEQVARSLRLAEQGVTSLPSSVGQHLASLMPQEALLGDCAEEDLQFLRMLQAGRPMGDIAAEFGCSERTLYRFQQDLFRRMGVSNRNAALAAAASCGLLE